MVVAQTNCLICGQPMIGLCERCNPQLVGEFEDPAKMTPMARYREVLFYGFRPAGLVDSNTVQERVEKLVGRPLRRPEGGPRTVSVGTHRFAFPGEWWDQFERLPEPQDWDGWHEYAKEAFHAFPQQPTTDPLPTEV